MKKEIEESFKMESILYYRPLTGLDFPTGTVSAGTRPFSAQGKDAKLGPNPSLRIRVRVVTSLQ